MPKVGDDFHWNWDQFLKDKLCFSATWDGIKGIQLLMFLGWNEDGLVYNLFIYFGQGNYALVEKGISWFICDEIKATELLMLQPAPKIIWTCWQSKFLCLAIRIFILHAYRIYFQVSLEMKCYRHWLHHK